jgi:hypothetical protein
VAAQDGVAGPRPGGHEAALDEGDIEARQKKQPTKEAASVSK